MKHYLDHFTVNQRILQSFWYIHISGQNCYYAFVTGIHCWYKLLSDKDVLSSWEVQKSCNTFQCKRETFQSFHDVRTDYPSLTSQVDIICEWAWGVIEDATDRPPPPPAGIIVGLFEDVRKFYPRDNLNEVVLDRLSFYYHSSRRGTLAEMTLEMILNLLRTQGYLLCENFHEKWLEIYCKFQLYISVKRMQN